MNVKYYSFNFKEFRNRAFLNSKYFSQELIISKNYIQNIFATGIRVLSLRRFNRIIAIFYEKSVSCVGNWSQIIFMYSSECSIKNFTFKIVEKNP